MKTKLYHLIYWLALPFILGGCASDELFTVIDTTPGATTITAASSDNSVVLLKENTSDEALTISWNKPDYGVPTEQASYQILIDFENGDFSSSVTAASTKTETNTFLVEELNKSLLELEVTPETATNILFKVVASTGALTTESNIITVELTAYADKLDLSTAWGLVGDATPNGWDGPDIPFYKTSTPNEFVAYPTLVAGEVKFRKDNKWDVNYGDGDLDGTLDDGANIPVDAGTYKVTFNETTLKYSIEEFTWGLVGSATPNGWDGPDFPLTYDATTDTWKAVITLIDGDVKFRQNNDWAVNYGDATLDGVLDTDADNNIAVSAGNYLVIMNTNTLEYSIEGIDVWGVVGDATPNSWDGPDTKFSLDFSQEGVWYLNNMTLVDGQIKFRTNDDWGLNYGDATLDGVLDGDNDNNIVVTAGVYDILLDFSNPSSPKYTLTKQ